MEYGPQIIECVGWQVRCGHSAVQANRWIVYKVNSSLSLSRECKFGTKDFQLG